MLVEAGPSLAGAFARAGLVDEYQMFVAAQAPRIQCPAAAGLAAAKMAEAPELKINDIRALGDDWRITAVPNIASASAPWRGKSDPTV